MPWPLNFSIGSVEHTIEFDGLVGSTNAAESTIGEIMAPELFNWQIDVNQER
jgi:hypothetical protein